MRHSLEAERQQQQNLLANERLQASRSPLTVSAHPYFVVSASCLAFYLVAQYILQTWTSVSRLVAVISVTLCSQFACTHVILVDFVCSSQECPMCARKLPNARALRSHLDGSDMHIQFPCLPCGRLFCSQRALRHHTESCHSSGSHRSRQVLHRQVETNHHRTFEGTSDHESVPHRAINDTLDVETSGACFVPSSQAQMSLFVSPTYTVASSSLGLSPLASPTGLSDSFSHQNERT